MPDIREIPGSCEDWLKHAKSDLALAKAPLPEGAMYEGLAFHAQQAAEKAIKAVYIKHGIRFHYTHDIAKLLSGIVDASIPLDEAIKSAAALTTYAWESRYPYPGEPVTEEEYRVAVIQSEMVVAWAEKQIM